MSLKAELGLRDEAEVAEMRGLKIPALRNERCKGLGPPYTRIGKKIFYPLETLKKFLAASTVTPSRPTTLVNGNRPRAKRART